MAFVSRAHASAWTAEASSFNRQVATLLDSGGLEAAQPCTTSPAAAAAAATQLHRHGSAPVAAAAAAAAAVASPRSSQACTIGPHPGYAWVDAQGQPLVIGPPAAAAANHPSADGAASSQATQQQQHPGASLATLSATQRSMVLWKRVSPGMLPDTSATPLSAYAELHAVPQQTEELDTTHHLKRTDFAEYTEAKLRHHMHIKAAATRP